MKTTTPHARVRRMRKTVAPARDAIERERQLAYREREAAYWAAFYGAFVRHSDSPVPARPRWWHLW